QYALFPVVAAIPFPILRRFRTAKFLGTLLVVALLSASALAYAVRQPWMSEMRIAYRVNFVFDTLLPLTDDRTEALRVLELPARCEAFVGHNWTSYAEQIQGEIKRRCPEVANVSPFRYVVAMWRLPETIPRLVAIGLDHTRPYLDPRV